MGFLYQVLKDVSEKQPYSVGKETLKNLVSNVINKHFCSGHEGFKTLFTVLPDRIAAYNREVQEGNEKVKRPIDKLKNEMKELEKQVSTILNDNSAQATDFTGEKERVGEQLQKCKQYAKYFNDVFDLDNLYNSHMKTSINDLHSKLRDSVLVCTKTVKHESERLDKLWNKEWTDFRSMKRTVRLTMEKLKTSVNDAIREKVGKLVNDLRDLVAGIKRTLDKIYFDLGNYVADLRQWISTAEGTMGTALGKVGEIVETVGTGGHKAKKQPVVEAANALKVKADDLRSRAYKAKEQVETLVAQALGAVKTMDDALRKNLKDVRDGIKGELNNYVRGGMAEQLQLNVDELVKSIYDKNGDKGHLYDVEKKLKEYAQKFGENGEQGFKKIVNDWIDDILKKDGVVNQRLSEYITKNKSHSYFVTSTYKEPTSLHGAITEAIMRKLEREVEAAVQVVASDMQTDNGIQRNIEAVKNCVYTFIIGLDGKLRIGKLEVNFVKKVVEEVENTLAKNTSKSSGLYYSLNLQIAVEAILVALYAAARQVYEELEWFTSDDHSDYNFGEGVENAIKDIQALGGKIKSALSDPALSSGPSTLGDNVMVEINRKLNDKIGNDEKGSPSNRVTLPTDTFNGYLNSVNTTGLRGSDAALQGNPGEGKLPVAIKQIEQTINHNETYLQHVVKDTSNSGDVKSDLKFYTDTFEKLFDTVKRALNVLCEAVEKIAGKGDDAEDGTLKHVLETFCDQAVKGINANQLTKILNDLTHLMGRDVVTVIEAANSFITKEASQFEGQCVNALYEHVNSQIKDATSTLTTAA
ncbi:hypothetical protein, conserved, partial [Babesia bigemina]